MFNLLIALMIAMSGFIPLEQDAAGTWQLDSFPEQAGKPFMHLIVLETYSPKDGEGVKSWISGKPDSYACTEDIRDRIENAKVISKKIIETAIRVYDNKYVISVSVSVCHPEWIVIYVHDFEDFVGKGELLRLQKALRE